MRKILFIIIFAVTAELTILCSVNSVNRTVSVSTADSCNLPTIVVDAGHGGIDGGAVGADKTVEKDINLEISIKLKDLLSFYGFNVIMTREDDRLISDAGLNTIRKQKVSDLRNRLDLLNSYDNALLLSIHQNKYSESKYSGAQVFYSPNNDKSKDLALILQDMIKNKLQPENIRAVKKSGSEIYLLYQAKSPAVMIECGFMSNTAELQNLKDDTYQSKMAFSIVCGVIEYLNETG